MTHKHIFKVIGNGDCRQGKAICTALAQRLQHARTKHPVFAKDAREACEVVRAELVELYCAESVETPERYADEALDVMATATRAYNREWDQHGAA